MNTPSLPELIIGPPLGASSHRAILPELEEWAASILAPSILAPNILDQRDRPALDAPTLAAAFAHSRHLQAVVKAHPDAATVILSGNGDQVVSQAMAELLGAATQLEDDTNFMAAVRRLRQRSGLAVMLSDIADIADIDCQMRWLSDAADAALNAAVIYLFRQAERRGQVTGLTPSSSGLPGCGWTVLALGKLGARELNYSSDLDLILLHDPQATPLINPEIAQRFYVEMARSLVRLLGHQTGDGIGWRIDLRLRPDPGATAVSIQREAAIGYYESIARTWERAAFIRARPAAGDIALGHRFLEDIQPFIWRKTLDYTVMDDMKTMLRRPVASPGWTGFNLKTGPNGIRSIEFLTHVLQLVAGGRAPEIRQGSTLPALHKLASGGWITEEQAHALGGLYHSLRRTEHRLQMIADGQTHSLPRSDRDLADFACFLGHQEAESFFTALTATLDGVARNCTHRLFNDIPNGHDNAPLFEDSEATTIWIEQMGFSRPADIASILSGWMAGRIPTTRGERARSLLNRIIPDVVQQLALAENPDAAFASFASFVEGLPASVQIFSLLDHNRDLTRLLCDILVLSPRLTNQLRRHPMLFDLVLFRDFFAPLDNAKAFEDTMRRAITDQSVEEALDTITRLTRERRFRAEVQILSHVATRQTLGTSLADTADAVIRVITDLAHFDMQRRHGKIDGRFDVLALGRLGTRDLTATSDLDLVYVWQASEDVRSEGTRSLAAGPYFMRLAQTLTSWLGGATSEGRLFNVDLRLRPDGDKGPIAPSLVRLQDYFAGEAWLWERLAFAKARWVSSTRNEDDNISPTIANITARPAAMEETASALQDMRKRLRASYGAAPQWQLRKQHGGIAELDLLLQGLRLIHANRFDPEHTLPDQILSRLVAVKALGQDDAETLGEASVLFSDLHHAMRLVMGGADQQIESLSKSAIQFVLQSCDSPDIDNLNGRLTALCNAVEMLFDRFFGGQPATLSDE